MRLAFNHRMRGEPHMTANRKERVPNAQRDRHVSVSHPGAPGPLVSANSCTRFFHLRPARTFDQTTSPGVADCSDLLQPQPVVRRGNAPRPSRAHVPHPQSVCRALPTAMITSATSAARNPTRVVPFLLVLAQLADVAQHGDFAPRSFRSADSTPKALKAGWHFRYHPKA